MVYSVFMLNIACIPIQAMWVPGLSAAPTSKCQSAQVLSIIGTVNGGMFSVCDLVPYTLPCC